MVRLLTAERWGQAPRRTPFFRGFRTLARSQSPFFWTMKRLLSEYRLFLREFWSNYHTTGAILPSGPWLAAALARYVGKGDRPQRILEVGPGTGAVTRRIARAMRPADRLDLVELNGSFVRAAAGGF